MLLRVRGLYAICDVDFLQGRGVESLAFVDALLQARPAAVQLRAKSLGAGAALELLRAIQARSAPFGVPVFANDRPDLALLAGCAGVHLGQTDLSLADARRVAPGLAVGISTHDLDQVDRALALRPDYLALGPIFPTSSKSNPDPTVGLAALAEASRRCRAASVPLVAIGGLSLERASAVAEFASAGAVIAALLPAAGLSGVARAAALLHASFAALLPP
jgi:thiamine-phosphate pyrophosphorylase